MRNIKDCYKRLKINEDTLEHGDFVSSAHGRSSIYTKEASIYFKSNEETICKNRGYVGFKIWRPSLLRRIK